MPETAHSKLEHQPSTAKLIFLESEHDAGEAREVEDDKEWRHCRIYRRLAGPAGRCVIWCGGDEYEGLGEANPYTIGPDGEVRDGDGDVVPTRPVSGAVRPC